MTQDIKYKTDPLFGNFSDTEKLLSHFNLIKNLKDDFLYSIEDSIKDHPQIFNSITKALQKKVGHFGYEQIRKILVDSYNENENENQQQTKQQLTKLHNTIKSTLIDVVTENVKLNLIHLESDYEPSSQNKILSSKKEILEFLDRALNEDSQTFYFDKKFNEYKADKNNNTINYDIAKNCFDNFLGTFAFQVSEPEKNSLERKSIVGIIINIPTENVTSYAINKDTVFDSPTTNKNNQNIGKKPKDEANMARESATSYLLAVFDNLKIAKALEGIDKIYRH